MGTGLVGTAVLAGGEALKTREASTDTQPALIGPGETPITLKVNGQTHSLKVSPRVTLADALRNHLDLTGTKVVCDRGSCGGCTVLVDGKTAYSCMMLAVDAEGKEVTTVEGLARGSRLHPVQSAFIEHDALMCGFCTPGFIISVSSLLSRTPRPTLEQVKESVSGNVCRCGAYPNIFKAALAAAEKNRKEG
ncbi:MAG: (2Fe-2S)-binding protein [Armatimonadetes bacterium]|nr:(2Fe-2S)-binding protein [Armatimonadota bacterium]